VTRRRLLPIAHLAWLVFPLFVAGTAIALMRFNRRFYSNFFNSDIEAPLQFLQACRNEVLFTHSSGVAWGHLAALVLGAALVLYRLRPVMRAGDWTDMRRRLPGSLLVAAAGGGALAMVNLVVAAPRANAEVGHSCEGVVGWPPGLLLVLAAGLVAFPLYALGGAAVGAVLAATVGRWSWLLVAMVVMLWLPAQFLGFMGGSMTSSEGAAGWGGLAVLTVAMVLLPPAAETALTTFAGEYASADATSFLTLPALALVLVPALYAVVWYRLARRLLARRAAGADETDRIPA
jgi:hypothetical protein